MDRKDAESIFTRARNIKALVIGDLMLDEYLWGKAERISPEAPVQVVDVKREDLRLGGAGNVANNMAAFGCGVYICGIIGRDDNGVHLRRTFSGRGVDTSGIFDVPSRMTGKKTRVLASNQQIVRIDRETRGDITEEEEDLLISFVRDPSHFWNIILVSDYGKGVLTRRVLEEVISFAGNRGIPVIVDPKGADFTKYRGATIITPNRKEAETASRIPILDEDTLGLAAGRLLEEGGYEALLVTRSAECMSLFLRER